jgi:hypothetical protein
MPLLFAVAALLVILAAGALEIGARRQSLRAPEGAADRVPDVYELAYLAGGPERHGVIVVEALARGNIIGVDGKGRVALRESHGPAGDASTGELVPAHPSLAAAVNVLAAHGGAMPLGRLADRMRHTSAMAGHAVALRGAAAVRDPELREQLGALEAAGTRGWAWRPAERPDETVAETTPPVASSRFPRGY